jgi:PAS domain S-box-containing protein
MKSYDQMSRDELLHELMKKDEHAAEALRKNDMHYRALFTRLNIGYALHEIICDELGTPIDYRFLESNDVYEVETGIEMAAVKGKTVLELFSDTETLCIEVLGNVALTGVSTRFENYDKNTDRYYEVFAFSPARGHFAVLVTNITKRKSMEKALRESEAHCRLLFDAVPIGLGIADLNGKVLKFNKAMQKVTGFDEDDYRHMRIADVYENPLDRVHMLNAIRDFGEVRDFEVILRNKEGAPYSALMDVELTVYDGQQVVLTCLQDITERKKLDEERQQFFKLFHSSEDLLIVADSSGYFKTINPSCIKVLGYSEKELLAKPYVDFVHPDDRQATLDQNALQVQCGYSTNFINRFVCKDGSTRYLSWNTIFIADEGIVYATARDITEQKETQDKLAKVMREQQIILENAPVGIYLVIDRKQVWVNRKAEELFQYSKEEIEGQTTLKLYPSPEAYEQCGKAAYPVLAQGLEFEDVQQLRRRDGSRIWIRYVGRAVAPPDMSKGTIWILEDITERKLVAEALQESESQYKNLVENIPDYVMRYDREHRHLYGSSKTILGCGKTPDTFLGKTHKEMGFSEDSCAVFEQALDESFQTGELQQRVIEWESAFGTKSLEWRIIPEVAPDGSIHTALGLSRDITERKRAEELQRESEETLRNLMEIMPVGVLMVGGDGSIEYVNRCFKERFGYSLEDIPTLREWYSKAYPDLGYRSKHIADTNAGLAEAQTRGIPVAPMEADITCKDGVARHIILNRQLSGDRRIVIFTDITERELLQNEIMKAQKLDALGILAGGIAHATTS